MRFPWLSMPMARRRGGADSGTPRAGERERVPPPASWRARASGGSRLAPAEYAPAAGFGGEYPPGGLDTFAAMQRDAQVRACLTTKRLAVLSEGVEVHPADDSNPARRAADAVREQVDALPGGGAAGVVEGALDALAMGYAVGELVWALDGSLEAVRWHDPRRFAFHAGPSGAVEEVEVLDAGGLRFPASRFLLYAYQGCYGSPYGESDLVAAYRAWWTKDNLRRLWLAGLDRFGVPTPVARIPAGYSAEMARQVSERLGSIQAGGALTVPADVEVSFDLDAGRVEPARAYVTAIEYEDRQIARAILGGELTATGGDGAGSYALGRVHREVADDWIGALRRDIAGRVLTGQLARAVALYAAGPDAPCPRVRFPDLSPAELSARRDLVARMVEGGVIAPDEGWLRAYLGLPARETTP